MHQFYAIAFEENLSLRQLAPFFPNARVSPHEIYTPIGAGGGVYIYSFGALVTHDIAADRRESEMSRLRRLVPKLTAQVVREDYIVAEDPSFEIGVNEGMLRVDRFTAARAGVVALTVAQSAAMEYYERIVDGMFTRTSTFVERLERHGTVSFRTRPLHRFIGEAITTRAEVLSILHLLDKPDATWEDRAMDRIYDDLRRRVRPWGPLRGAGIQAAQHAGSPGAIAWSRARSTAFLARIRDRNSDFARIGGKPAATTLT